MKCRSMMRVTARAVGMEMTEKIASWRIPGNLEVATSAKAATVVPHPNATGMATAARALLIFSRVVPFSW